MKLTRRLLLFLTLLPVLVGLMLLFIPVRSPVQAGSSLPDSFSQDFERIEPDKLIFLLQYLGTDYGAAVESGQVISEFEYQEMLDFSQLLLEESRQLDVPQEILTQLENIRPLRKDVTKMVAGTGQVL